MSLSFVPVVCQHIVSLPWRRCLASQTLAWQFTLEVNSQKNIMMEMYWPQNWFFLYPLFDGIYFFSQKSDLKSKWGHQECWWYTSPTKESDNRFVGCCCFGHWAMSKIMSTDNKEVQLSSQMALQDQWSPALNGFNNECCMMTTNRRALVLDHHPASLVTFTERQEHPDAMQQIQHWTFNHKQ